MATVLSASELEEFLTGQPEWSGSENGITRTFTCPTFPAAIEFVSRVAVAAEKANHHPDIDIRWRKVTLTLSTHSEGGVTELDTELAQTINQIAAD